MLPANIDMMITTGSKIYDKMENLFFMSSLYHRFLNSVFKICKIYLVFFENYIFFYFSLGANFVLKNDSAAPIKRHITETMVVWREPKLVPGKTVMTEPKTNPKMTA